MAVTEQGAAIERARKGYADFDAGNIQGIDATIADDTVWHVAGNSRFAGDYKGKQATCELFGRFFQEGVVQKHDIHDILASDQHVVVLSTVTVTYKGKSLTLKAVDVIHENGQGQTAEWWRFAEGDGQKQFDELVAG